MTNKKNTRRALFMSALSLILCFAMLMGTTFAWFTDSAASGSNVIASGNLDIEVQYTLDGKEWKDLNGANDLFKKGLWEPGHTEVVALKIENKGSLALKYNANMNVVNENQGTNKAGEKFALSEVLNVSTLVQQANDAMGIGEITLMLAFAGENGVAYENTASFAKSEILRADQELHPGDSHYMFVKVDMPETVGNEANHNGEDLPSINFGINVLATQFTYESDTFGNQYDKDSEYPVIRHYDHVVSDSDALVNAFASGGNIKLEDDIELESILNVEEGAEVYLDMNGKTLTVTNTDADPAFYTKKNSKLIIDGNGTVELAAPGMSLIFPGGDVVIENGTFTRNVPEGTTAKNVGSLIVGAKVSPWGSQSIVINGGYFDGGYYDANAADIEGILAGTVEFSETADDIAKRGNSKDANSVRVALKNNVSSTLNLSYNLMKVYGGTFVGMNPAWGDEGCMLPTTPNYLRPWSYYQGALLDGQVFHEDGIVLPTGYTITNGTTADGRPTYTVTYNP